jgi:hypothetical protein
MTRRRGGEVNCLTSSPRRLSLEREMFQKDLTQHLLLIKDVRVCSQPQSAVLFSNR